MSPVPQIRDATGADAPALLELIRAAYRSPRGWASESHLIAGERIDDAGVARLLAAPAGATLVAQDAEGAVLGCCHVAELGGGVASLGTFAVDPDRQGSGAGRALLAAGFRVAAARLGAETIEIEVLRQLPQLVAFYERRGFRATGERRPFGSDPVFARPLVDGLEFEIMRARPAPALSWSGGKDSALCLQALRDEGREPGALLTTVTADHARVSMHGVRRELLAAQAHAVGVELVEVLIDAGADNEAYTRALGDALSAPPLEAVGEVAFGDLFLADVRAFREQSIEALGRRAAFPLWGRDTARLARRFVAEGWRATIVCVDPAQLDPEFAGRAYDAALLDALPASVDPCGENGEFHTFVHDGPPFARPVPVRAGEVVTREGFVFADLRPA